MLGLATAASAATPSDFFSDLEAFRAESLSIRTEEGNLEAADAALTSRKLFWTPTLDASAARQRTESAGTAAESDLVGVEMSLNLYRSGGDWQRMREAEARRRAQGLELKNEILRVELRGADVVFKGLYLAEMRRLEEGILKLKEDSLRIVKDRYRQGKTPLQEVSKAEVDLVQQRSRLRKARLDELENRQDGLALFVKSIRTTSWPFDENQKPRLPLTAVFPEIEQKNWETKASEAAWKSAGASHFPSLDLSASYLKPVSGENRDGQVVASLRLTVPLWSRMETSASVATAYAGYLGSVHELKSLEVRTRLRKDLLEEKVTMAREDLSEAKKNLEKSKALYRDVLNGYRLGRVSTNDLLIEQNRLFTSENAVAASQLAFHQSLMESCALRGIEAKECLAP